jgi:hypothetical protein
VLLLRLAHPVRRVVEAHDDEDLSEPARAVRGVGQSRARLGGAVVPDDDPQPLRRARDMHSWHAPTLAVPARGDIRRHYGRPAVAFRAARRAPRAGGQVRTPCSCA